MWCFEALKQFTGPIAVSILCVSLFPSVPSAKPRYAPRNSKTLEQTRHHPKPLEIFWCAGCVFLAWHGDGLIYPSFIQIDDLKVPYTTYCTKFCAGFDVWEPVQSNQKLSGILAAFSAACPPPTSSNTSSWTLDALFLLPKTRLSYYKKLYGRLLKTTEPGRSDYRLLVGALDTLEFLLGVVESRSTVKPGGISDSTTTGPGNELVNDTSPADVPLTLNVQSASESDVGSPLGGSVSDR